MAYAVAVDIGGTFTDLVAFDYERGAVAYAKAPTTYGNFVEGILTCFEKALIKPRDVSIVSHGTTLVINAILQRRGANAALVTTKGFRDLLEIARGNRADPFDLHYRRDEPLIPRERRLEVAERVNAKGEVVQPLDTAGLEALAVTIREMKIESVAIFFLNSYLNPTHEQRAAEILRRLLPDVFVTVSTDLTQEWFEYERTSTAAANAFVGPQVNRYIHRLEDDLKAQQFAGNLFMMGSNGGVLSVDRTVRQPIALVESGPIGGCIGAGAYGAALGMKNIIAFDMGGTTAKCALVQNGTFAVNSVYYVGGYTHGFPIKSPVINIVEVGSGGGSIARLDGMGQLHVGPESAGSTPGPVCYGRGGTEPTVTDANLVLGRLNAENFLGGELALDAAGATRAIDALAQKLGYQGEDRVVHLADGIIAIATVIMAGAIRRVSIEHGLDPRDFVLFCYGGGGPLHGSALAHELSIPTVVIPPEPGNFSAVGMLLADARIDQSLTFAAPLDDKSAGDLQKAFAGMEAAVAKELRRDFGDDVEVRYERHAEMRYRGQRSNIKVAIDGLTDPAAFRRAFEEDYRKRFGQINERGTVEFQVLTISGFAALQRPEIERLPRAATASPAPRKRQVHFGQQMGMREATVLQRTSLRPGHKGEGPAVIEEYGSTTVIWPGDTFEIGKLGEIWIRHNTTAQVG